MTELLDREEQTPISSGEDDARQFLSEIRRYPLLTPDEERKLARRCAEGDEDAIRQMVNSNLRLVVSVARGNEFTTNPAPDFVFESGDLVWIAGQKEGCDKYAA